MISKTVSHPEKTFARQMWVTDKFIERSPKFVDKAISIAKEQFILYLLNEGRLPLSFNIDKERECALGGGCWKYTLYYHCIYVGRKSVLTRDYNSCHFSP